MIRIVVAYFAVAWLVIQVLETIFPLFGVPDEFIRWIIIGFAILLVPVIAFSWVFEWSASGIESQADLDQREVRPSASSQKFDRAVIVALSLAVLYFAADKFLFPSIGLGVQKPPSIAVLPFIDRTATQDRTFLGDGLAEDLLNLLARNSQLRVAASLSSFAFRNSDQKIGEVAAQLGVSHIVTGSIQGDGDQQRISVQLVTGDDGFTIWSSVFDRQPDELLSVATEIQSNVESVLDVSASSVEQPGRPPDPEAYVLMLRANYLSKDSNEASRNQAVELYLQAVDLDPDYSLAWSNLATTYINQTIAGFLDREEGYRKSRDAALQSIAVNAHHAPGYKALAFIEHHFLGDMQGAVENMQRALDEGPNYPTIVGDAAVVLLNIGQLEDAIRIDEYLAERSPLNFTTHWNLALAYRYADRLEESAETFRYAQKLAPEKNGLNYHIGETTLLMGRYSEALEYFAADADESYALKGRALANFALGNQEPANDALDQLVAKYGDQWPSEIAHVYAYRGELDEAFAWLDKEYDAYGPGGWGEWQLQRLFDNLRGDPRWIDFLNRTGTGPQHLAGLNLRIDYDF